MLLLILLAAFYLAGRESQLPMIQEQSEQIEQLQNEHEAERVARAKQLNNLFAQVRQTQQSLRRHVEEPTIEDPGQQSEDTSEY